MGGRTETTEGQDAGTQPRVRARRLVPAIRVAALSGLLGALLSWPTIGQDITFFQIGTGASDGTFFVIGGLLASAISNPPGSLPCDEGGSCGVPGVIAVAQTTDGSVQNLKEINAGNLDSGLAEADIAYWAFNGAGPYAETGELDNLRAIASLYPESVHIVVRRGSGIYRVSQLRGKHVSIGPKGSGTRVQAEVILKAFGVGLADIEPLYLTPGQASDRLRKREIDAFFVVAGYPVNAITNLAESMRIGLIDLKGKAVDRLTSSYPFFTKGSIPAGTYDGVLVTPTLNVGAQWIVSKAADEELVYGITRALWDQSTRRLLDSGHPDGRRIRLETALKGLAVPLHPGAERYYREVGLLK